MSDTTSLLSGRRIILTRPRAQVPELWDRLGSLGAEVIDFSGVRGFPPDDLHLLRESVSFLENYDWVLFGSVYATDAVLAELGKDAPGAMAQTRLATNDPATVRRLNARQIPVHLTADPYDWKHLCENLQSRENLNDKMMLYPCGEGVSDEVIAPLRQAGAQVDQVAAYRLQNEGDSALEAIIRCLQADVAAVVFLSSESVYHFTAGLERMSVERDRIRCISVGSRTTATLQELQLGEVHQALSSDTDGLVEAIIRALS